MFNLPFNNYNKISRTYMDELDGTKVYPYNYVKGLYGYKTTANTLKKYIQDLQYEVDDFFNAADQRQRMQELLKIITNIITIPEQIKGEKTNTLEEQISLCSQQLDIYQNVLNKLLEGPLLSTKEEMFLKASLEDDINNMKYAEKKMQRSQEYAANQKED